MKLPLLFFALLTATAGNGQALKSIGFKSGVSVANQTWYYKRADETWKRDNRAGFYAAASVEFLDLKYLSLITDIGYSAKGYTEKVPGSTGDKTYDTKFNYFTLSPMLKVRYESTHFIPYALLGLRMDYQLSYNSDFNLKPIEKDFHKAVYGANFGAGVEYKIKQWGIFLEGQYQYDFSKVIDIPVSENNIGIGVKNDALIISAGLKYYLAKKKLQFK